MAVTLFALLACQEADQTSKPPADTEPVGGTDTLVDDVEPVATMEPLALLARASLDIRGVRPTLQEIETVEADPSALDGLVQGFLEDPRFEDRIRAMYADVYLTRLDKFPVSHTEYGLTDQATFVSSIGDESLHLLSWIIANDLPYSELVTADWTVANEQLAEIWPIDYPQGATGWQKATYTDGRPSAGVLSQNSLWWRYQSTESNANRGRANAMSRILLCNDYLSKPIEFDRNVNLLDQGALNEALQNNPGCVACHTSLEPLSAYFWGFYYYLYTTAADTTTYHPEREYLWQTYGTSEPGYYGMKGYDLENLGEQIAEDPRFVQCAVETAWSVMLGRDVMIEDTTTLLGLRDVMLEADLQMKPVFAEIVGSDAYRAAIDSTDVAAMPEKMAGLDLLASAIEDLTGFRFIADGFDVVRFDEKGVRTLAGGVDGEFVTRASTEPTTTMMLVVERLTQAASWYVVDNDAAHPDQARLFTEVTFQETPASGEEAIVAQIQALHLAVLSQRVEADGPEVQANLELWKDLYEADFDQKAAWSGLLSVLLRDPDFLFY